MGESEDGAISTTENIDYKKIIHWHTNRIITMSASINYNSVIYINMVNELERMMRPYQDKEYKEAAEKLKSKKKRKIINIGFERSSKNNNLLRNSFVKWENENDIAQLVKQAEHQIAEDKFSLLIELMHRNNLLLDEEILDPNELII